MFEEILVPMRDGAELLTRVWKPSPEGRFPTILERGYDAGVEEHAARFVASGYAYVGQQSRGNLEGGMFRSDAVDGHDCTDWIVGQPWCDGRVAMYGRSFMAATQWLTAPLQHPNLKAIVPQVVNPDLWSRGYWDHGALQLSHTARRIYRTRVSDDNTHRVAEFGGWDAFYPHLPLITLDEAVVGQKNRLWQEYVSHSQYDDYWKEISIRDKFDLIRIPVYIHAGWYDNYAGVLFDTYQTLRELGATDELRIHADPTDHDGAVVGDRDFGDAPAKSRLELAVRWLDYVVRGIENGIREEPPVSIFVMGANEFRSYDGWPPPEARLTEYFLHSDGSRHGQLSTEPPRDEPLCTYVYDPDDPVPTLGGNHSGPQDHPEIIRVGALDQRPNWSREDVLVFETPPLDAAVEITGPIKMKLFAATSAPDTDFIARLIDVGEDGVAYNLTDGIMRARFRKSIWEEPELLEPGEVYEYSIELQPTSNVFKRGHRICLHVTSSSFPMYDRNPNTGHAQGMDSELQVARQTVYHDASRPSHIVLPVIELNGDDSA